MEKLNEQIKEKLDKVLLKDTGLYDPSDGEYSTLWRSGINTVGDILDEEHTKKCKKINSHKIQLLISMIKYKYLGIPLQNIEFLSKKINLDISDIWFSYFEYEDGEKEYLYDIFPTLNLDKYARIKYEIFCDKKDEYPDGKAPLIDYFRYLLASYSEYDENSNFNNGYKIVKAYVDCYDGVVSTYDPSEFKLQDVYKGQTEFLKSYLDCLKDIKKVLKNDFESKIGESEKLEVLKSHLEDLNVLKSMLDSQIFNVKAGIDEISIEYSNKQLRK